MPRKLLLIETFRYKLVTYLTSTATEPCPMQRLLEQQVPINYLLVNLAVADIMFATFLTPQYILSHTFTHPDRMTGTVLCKLLTGGNFAWVGAASSVFTLANISIERYYAVMYPLGNKGKLTEHKLMGVLKVRKRVTLAVVVVSVIFGICWITDSIVYIVSHFKADSFGPAVYSISNTMIMFNSAVNPFVYALLNQRFREKIKSTISCTSSSTARVHPSRSEPPTIELANSNTNRSAEVEC
ncbi:hypothetical protein ACROYT_G038933 [Oculina patagonica]